MDIKKVLYVSQQIEPYVEANALSTYCRTIAQSLQEKGVEVRTFMPRYGAINERRNQLHEVIRLSCLNIPIGETDHPLIIKVATLQPTRLQVYFIDNDDYFQRHSSNRELETSSSTSDNDERSIFFVRGVAETVKKLRWEPSIIQATGWLTALLPVYFKKIYHEDPTFANSKVVYTLTDEKDADQELSTPLAEKLLAEGFSAEQLEVLKGKDRRSLHKLAIDHADAIAVGSADADAELVSYAKASGKPVLDYPGTPEEAGQAYLDFYKSL